MAEVLMQRYTDTEERVHAASHAAGAILSVIALFWMVKLSSTAADPWRIFASGIYGSSLVALFAASTIYHSLHSSPLTRFYKLLDHCAIYLLIAGTSTPFLLVAMTSSIRWWLFAAMWSLAAAGIAMKILFGHRHPRLSMASYLLMGWLMIVAVPQLIDAIGAKGMTWVLAGGVLYTVGAAFYMAKRMYFHHVIWHLFVLAGATCHFLAVTWYVLPVRDPL